jgi:YlmC/YmxH family sporulation protein
MRLSDFLGKEVINLVDGSKIGRVSKIDFLIDLEKAMIRSIILPGKGFFFRVEQEIPWTAVKKISHDLVLLECEEKNVTPSQ